MSILRKLNRENKKVEEAKQKAKDQLDRKRFKQEVMTTNVMNGELYQRHWDHQPIIATKCKLVVKGSGTTTGEYGVVEEGTIVEAIEIADFRMWLNNTCFYVLNEQPEETEHDLWYMMQFPNFAPMGMKRVVHLEPEQGSVEYIRNRVLEQDIEPSSEPV